MVPARRCTAPHYHPATPEPLRRPEALVAEAGSTFKGPVKAAEDLDIDDLRVSGAQVVGRLLPRCFNSLQ